jgi:DNA-binding LacI/PurR family transcriptional regulator
VNRLVAVILAIGLVITACAPLRAQQEVTPTPPMDANPTTELTATAAPTAAPTSTAALTDTAERTPAPGTGVAPLPGDVQVLEDLVELELKGSFDFFWEQANTDVASPGYGLIRDRYPGAPGVASIAAVGFGLTAYLIGIDRGYITYAEGQERVSRTLDTLLQMERVHGFYFHFVDMETGRRVWRSEVSTIDTAILLMGVLSVGQYFGGEIGAKAKTLYDGVEWPWFVDESREMFYMAYRPEKGFEGHWDYYAEQLMLYVLAAGSDTHPVDASTYYGFVRHYARYRDGQPFIHSWFGSIFTYQFSHAWIDFRDTVDQEGVNWFDNSVQASLAQIAFATDEDSRYPTLGPTAWGLTASDGPDGYNGLYGAPPSGSDNQAHFIDDTVAPSGAIGSVIFVPDRALQALQHYYTFERLRGPYGLQDAFNLSEDWYAGDVIGIDKGIILLMLANHQNDLVHRVVMQNEQIQNGLSRLQITKRVPGGGRMPTIKDVARRARVSIATASYALNGNGSVSAATRTRVLAAAEELNYHPNAFARHLKKRKTQTIGVFITRFGGSFYDEILEGIHDVALRTDYELMVCPDSRSKRRILAHRQVDGAIVFDTKVGSDVLIKLASQRFPIVVMDRDLRGECLMPLLIDNEHGVQEAFRHLVEQGARSIYFVAGALDSFDNTERTRAFLSEANRHAVRVKTVPGNFTEQAGYESARAMIAAGDLPEAVLCANDQMAIGFMRAMHDHQLRVPEDVAVVGFDDIQIARFLRPPLSTVGASRFAWGAAAVTQLIDFLENGSPFLPHRIPTKLIQRQSSMRRGGAPPAG